MRHTCVSAALVTKYVDVHPACVDNHERVYDNKDSDQDRRLARLLLDANEAYWQTRSVDSIVRLGDAQVQLETALEPRRQW